METLKINIVQTPLTWECPEANCNAIGSLLAANTLGDVIILPEMFTTGFSMNTQLIAESSTEWALRWMEEQANKHNALLIGSCMFVDDNIYFNRLIAMYPGGRFQYYNKKHLFGLGKEAACYKAGDSRLLIEYLGWRICPFICYDLRFPVWCRNDSKLPYDISIYVANWPAQRHFAWQQLLVARAIENQSYTLGCNIVGTDGADLLYIGGSKALDATGQLIAGLDDTTGILTVSLSKSALTKTRIDLPFLNDAETFVLQ